MSLISRLAEKSWQTPGDGGAREPEDYRPTASTVGLYLYFGVATVIFTLMASAYVVRMGMPSVMEHGGGGDWQPMPEPPQVWINTGILIVSSVAWEAARRAAHKADLAQGRRMSVVGGALGVAFLVGQLLLWWQYQAGGYFMAANPANAFFYLLTTVHGLHLAGGLAALARVFRQLTAEGASARALRNIRLCAIYWHFLLLVWVLLVGLLVLT